MFAFLFCAFLNAQTPHIFKLDVTDSLGNVLKINASGYYIYDSPALDFEMIEQFTPARMDTFKISSFLPTLRNPFKRHYRLLFGEYIINDSLKRYKFFNLSIHYKTQIMNIISNQALPLKNDKGGSVGITKIAFVPNTTLYWEGKFDANHKPIFRRVIGLLDK